MAGGGHWLLGCFAQRGLTAYTMPDYKIMLGSREPRSFVGFREFGSFLQGIISRSNLSEWASHRQ